MKDGTTREQRDAYWQRVNRYRWLAGYIDEDGTGRGARPAACPRCHAACITGLDGDVLAFTVWVDPEPLTARGEFAALLAGRATFDLTYRRRPRGRGRYELDERLSWTIAARSADTLGRDVVGQHRCWQRIGDMSEQGDLVRLDDQAEQQPRVPLDESEGGTTW